jgi:hypothetical protein
MELVVWRGKVASLYCTHKKARLKEQTLTLLTTPVILAGFYYGILG